MGRYWVKSIEKGSLKYSQNKHCVDLEVLASLCHLLQSCGTGRGWADCVRSILWPDSNNIMSLTWAEAVPFIFAKGPLSGTQRVILVFPKLTYNWNSYLYPQKKPQTLAVRSSPRLKWNISTGCTQGILWPHPHSHFTSVIPVKLNLLIFFFFLNNNNCEACHRNLEVNWWKAMLCVQRERWMQQLPSIPVLNLNNHPL